MRVLLTVPSLDPAFGGPTATARSLAASLRGSGHDVVLIGGGHGRDAVALGEAFRFRATPVPRRLRPLLRMVGRAEVVHVLGYRDPVGTAAALAAWRSEVPYVLEPTGMLRRRLRKLALKRAFDATAGRLVIGGAARVVAASTLEGQELRASGVEPARIRIRPNGVRPDLAPPSDGSRARADLDVPESAPLVLTIARIAAIKGLDVLVCAVAELDDAHVVIAGPDERDGTLEHLLRLRAELGVDHRVRLVTGGLWGEAKRRALASADAFCLPSRYESFGTAAAEAAAAGLPVVCTAACGVAERLDAAASRVVPSGDPAALARGLREVLTEGARRAAAGDAVRIREELSWDRLADEQARIYREVLAG